MKKNIILILVLTMVVVLGACGKKENIEDEVPSPTPPVEDNNDLQDDNDVEDPVVNSEDGEDDLEETDIAEVDINEVEQEKLDKVKEAVEKAYGENYISNPMEIGAEFLRDLYGIEPDWYDGVIGESPMISTHIDTFIGLHPTAGNEDNIKNALEKYRDYLINDSMQYPMNMPRVNAAEILEEDGNFYFIMLGLVEDETSDEAKLIELYKEQNKIAIDVIKSLSK